METILVQDTDKDILELLTVALDIEGFTVYSMTDCDQGFLEFIEMHRPHVVILDYRLDGKACKDALQQIRSKYPHLPVIATSCNSNIHEVYDKHGFNDYIKKPFDLELLYSVLRKHIKKAG